MTAEEMLASIPGFVLARGQGRGRGHDKYIAFHYIELVDQILAYKFLLRGKEIGDKSRNLQ